ncbi:stage V sporulation protein B [Desulfotomaculum copahuensis]|uniref:Stage V sporulation protein B n=1 Tax=Desulfotomaculum copahuensis TaxID=1838280 RepID=A0A1B7LE71_9FIRM|nr:stage V sporulation protein B [Desulfotomaculum copahuensis]OAT81354.1 stage V sporulation protein B [Desulfotomaculum copahuensis]
MTRQSFVYGAFILLVASLFNRVIGFIYQIAMIRIIRPEGVGLFNMVYPIYVLVLVLAGAGIPVAIAKLVAEEVARKNLYGAYRIFTIAFWCITGSSVFLTGLLLFALPWIKQLAFPHPKVYYSLLALIPAIIIVSLCSAFRGFFQGLQQMTPTATTQVVEQIIRVTAGLVIAYLLLPRGVEYAAMGISLGVVCGELAGFLLMLFIYVQKRPPLTGLRLNLPAPLYVDARRIFQLAVPVTLTRFVSTALLSVDAILIPRRLQAAGLGLLETTATYGQLVGIAETLLFTPGIVTISLATALVPAISDALAQNDLALVRGRTEEALRLTMLAGLPTAAVFWFMPRELCAVLFGYGEAGQALAILALGGPFLYLQQTVTGVLQGLGLADRPLKNLLVASLFKIIGIYYLTAVPSLTVRGTAAAISLGYMIMALLNYLDLRRSIRLRVDPGYCLGKPLAATAGMLAVMQLWREYMFKPDSIFHIGFFLLLGGFTYLFILLLLGGVHRYDLSRLHSFLRLR